MNLHLKNTRLAIASLAVLVVLVALLPLLPFFRLDLTAEHRFSIAEQTKTLMRQQSDPIEITFYSGGNVDANFARLNNAARELIDELNAFARTRIRYRFENPSDANDDNERQRRYYSLEQRGLRGMSVASRDADGRLTQSIVFPWAEVSCLGDTMPVCLLQPDARRSGEEGINRAIENLEYEFTDAIRILTKKNVDKIAFIEGHGELSEEEVYSASEAFSRYFQIDRGTLGTDASVLADYKAIIIAKPTQPFSETDKYIIDQYIMNGGRVMWFVDGTQMQDGALTNGSDATLIPLDVNLQDQLFRYGVRIANDVVQDAQCAYQPVNIAAPSEQPYFEPVPWFYEPLLLTSPQSPITRNLLQVRANFASTLEFTNNADNQVDKQILLITSNATHVAQTPCVVSLQQMLTDGATDDYWFTRYQPVAALLEGQFTSIFPSRSRAVPSEIENALPHRDVSEPTRQLVVADGDLIRNDLEQTQQGWRVLPLGYDRVTHQTYGNRDFLLNSLLYLTDDADWLSLRNRQVTLRLLNRVSATNSRHLWQIINMVLPVLALLAAAGISFAVRRRRNGANLR